MDLERLPPHDIEAEEAVIGSLLVDGEALDRIEDFLRPEDFFREALRWSYEACLALADRREAINTITVAHELERLGRLQEIGGSGELHRLIAQVPTSPTSITTVGSCRARRSCAASSARLAR
jgi:replicative DNA helicase